MNISSEVASNVGSNSSEHIFFYMTEGEMKIYSILNLFAVLFGVPINTYVIWLIVTRTGNRLAAEFFSLNLAVCEMFFCIECVLTIFSYQFEIVSAAVYFFDGLAMTGRPLFQCLMCVERYLAVVHPVTFLKFKPLRYKVICCVFVWLVGFGSSLICMISFLSQDTYAYTWLYLLQFLVFLSIQLFCCLAVLRALKQSGPGERSREREEENHMKTRAFYLILITTVSMVIIYAPYIVTGIFFLLTQQEVLVTDAIGLICFILGSFVQPVLHLHRAGKLSCFCSS